MALNTEKMNPALLQDLQARGMTNVEISLLTAEQAFDEYCDWHGLVNWGPALRSAMIELKKVET